MPATVTGIGSLFNVDFTPEEPKEFRALQLSNREMLRLFHLGILEEGIVLATRGLGCISLPMSETEVDQLVSAASVVIGRIKNSGLGALLESGQGSMTH
jgi:glutamate-1-semialdehyde 2,1-aminomutase